MDMKQHKANDECLRDLLRGNVPGMADDFLRRPLAAQTGPGRCVPSREGMGTVAARGLAAAVLLVCHRQAWEGVLALSRWVVEAADRLGSLGSLDVRWVLAGGLAVVCGVLAYPLAKRWL